MKSSRKRDLSRILAAGVAVFSLSLGGVSGMAQSGDPVRVRGAVVSLDGSTLVVHSREGADLSIHLADNWGVVGVVKASMSDIKQGAFIGAASLPQPDSSLRAIEVLVFPEAMRGSGEGRRPWDLKPDSVMTNATVGDAVDGVEGRTVTLSYKGGEKKVTIPADAPIVTFSGAAKTDIKAGALVFVPTLRQPDGTMNANRIVVGKDGVAPPMLRRALDGTIWRSTTAARLSL
jgi:hypothetical protein